MVLNSSGTELYNSLIIVSEESFRQDCLFVQHFAKTWRDNSETIDSLVFFSYCSVVEIRANKADCEPGNAAASLDTFSAENAFEIEL
ncbi:hypothetical protein QYM36_008105 [Artemia franciscana]|uniref:Uncharacterized protein n=1 Tax=Artemia franciscana TaxID=6661 RepID=A0AA88LEE4_ARTSF|nr:hypothetical protein QYM36_008105 [Artemia franciscana]